MTGTPFILPGQVVTPLDDTTQVTPGPLEATSGKPSGPRPTSAGATPFVDPPEQRKPLAATWEAARRADMEQQLPAQDEGNSALAAHAKLDRLSQIHPFLRKRLAYDPAFAEAAIKAKDPEELIGLERLKAKYELGQVQDRMLNASEMFKRTQDPEWKSEYEYQRNRALEIGLKVDDPRADHLFHNSWSALGAAAIQVGQMENAFAEHPVEAGITAAAALGASVATGGIAALPILAGIGGGVTAHMIAHTYDVESGGSYMDLKEMGISEQGAQIGSTVVGLINAGFEGVGLTGIGKPIAKGTQKLLKAGMREALKSPKVLSLLQGFSKDYLTGVGAEVLQEVGQELTNIIDEKIQGGLEGIDTATPEEIGVRLEQILTQTLQAAAVLGVPGAAFNMAVDARTAKVAPKLQDMVDQLAGSLKDSGLAKQDPAVAAQYFKDSIAQVSESGEVYLDPEAVRQSLTPEEIASLGIHDDLQNALDTFGDVKMDAADYFTKAVVTGIHEKISDHMRVREQGMSRARAKEFEESGKQDERAFLERGSQVAGETEFVNDEISAEEEKAIQAEIDRRLQRIQADQTAQVAPEVGPDGNVLPPRQPSKEELQADPAPKPITPEDLGVQVNQVGANTVEMKPIEPKAVPLTDVEAQANKDAALLVDLIEEEIKTKTGNADAALRGAIHNALKEAMKRVPKDSPVQQALGIMEERRNIQANRTDPKSKAVTVAEVEAGLLGLFRSAKEMGVSMLDYKNYLAKLKKMQESGRQRAEARRLQAKARELTETWKREEANIRQATRETLMREKQWQAFFGLDGNTRLNREEVIQILRSIAADEEIVFTTPEGLQVWPSPDESKTANSVRAIDLLDSLPRHKNRNIYAPKTDTEGLSVDAYAQQHGYRNGYDMMVEFLTMPDFKTELETGTRAAMLHKHGDLLSEADLLRQARRDLLSNDASALVEAEMNAIRVANGQGRLKRSLIRQDAINRMREVTVEAVSAKNFIKQVGRLARLAEKAIRKGDLQLAGHYKYQQILNIEMAIEAEQLNKKLEKGQKTLQGYRGRKGGYKLVKGDVFDSALQELLDRANFRPRPLSPKNVGHLKEVLDRSNKMPVKVRKRAKALLAENSRMHWRQMKVGDFLDTVDQAKEIYYAGSRQYTMLKADEKARTQETLDEMTDAMDEVGKSTTDSERVKAKKNWRTGGKKNWTEFFVRAFHPETLVEQLDGGKPLGVWYQNTLGRIDQAYRGGYQPGQVGYIRRKIAEFKQLTKMWKEHLTKDQRKNLRKDWGRITGLHRNITGEEVLMVVMNSGNESNIEAMIRSGTITETEHELILQAAPKEFYDLAQAVWDNYGRLWQEVEKRERLRWRNAPDPVEATPFTNQHGSYKGGYFPIRWDHTESSAGPVATPKAFSSYVEGVRYGHFASSMTNRSHLELRHQASPANKMMLSASSLAGHIDQVIYDLEVGDAINDVYKLLYSKQMNVAFTQNGLKHYQEMLDIWLRDTITQELMPHDVLQRLARGLRRRTTMAALGLSVTTAVQQPFGLFQTAALVGKRNTIMATGAFFANPVKAYNQMVAESAYMGTRGETFHKDIMDAQTAFIENFGKDAKGWLSKGAFWMIKIMQRPVDVITYIGAKRKAFQMGMDGAEAITFAENSVRTSQASGWFHERSAFERGSTSAEQRQSDVVRLATTMQGYFIAKLNTAVQSFGRARNQNTVLSYMNFMANMVMLFTFDAMAGAALYGQLPDNGDPNDWSVSVLRETFGGIMDAIPFGRNIGGALTGKPTTGPYERLVSDTQQAMKQIEQGEPDWAAIKSITRVIGIAANKPTAVFTRIMDALQAEEDGHNTEWYHYITGYQEDLPK